MELPSTYWISCLVCVYECVCVCVHLIATSFAHCRMVFRRSSTTTCLSRDSGNFHSIVGVAPKRRKKKTVNFVLFVLRRVLWSVLFPPKRAHGLGGPHSLMFSENRDYFPGRWSGRGISFTTDLHVVPKFKNGWSYTYTPPACFSGVDRGFTFPM